MRWPIERKLYRKRMNEWMRDNTPRGRRRRQFEMENEKKTKNEKNYDRDFIAKLKSTAPSLLHRVVVPPPNNGIALWLIYLVYCSLNAIKFTYIRFPFFFSPLLCPLQLPLSLPSNKEMFFCVSRLGQLMQCALSVCWFVCVSARVLGCELINGPLTSPLLISSSFPDSLEVSLKFRESHRISVFFGNTFFPRVRCSLSCAVPHLVWGLTSHGKR